MSKLKSIKDQTPSGNSNVWECTRLSFLNSQCKPPEDWRLHWCTPSLIVLDSGLKYLHSSNELYRCCSLACSLNLADFLELAVRGVQWIVLKSSSRSKNSILCFFTFALQSIWPPQNTAEYRKYIECTLKCTMISKNVIWDVLFHKDLVKS